MSSPEQEHLESVRATLARVYRREQYKLLAIDSQTPLSALLDQERAENSDDEMTIGTEFVRRWLGWIFEAGPDPAPAVQRLYAFAQCTAPDLIANLRGEEIAAIFGQGRAADNARVCLLNKKLAAQGYANPFFGFQKTGTARATSARSQRGNKNRTMNKSPQ